MAVAPMRVLVVEDEADLGVVFQDFIASRGHTAEVVGSAEAALARLGAGQAPDAIVLDVKLPGMSGLDFMRLPVVREAAIPVIVVSGHATEHQARECLRHGALEFLTKPVPLEVLATVLEHAELFAPREGGPPLHERRLNRRVPVSLPVRIVTENGTVATGRTLEISATGLRARLDTPLRAGAAVRVTLTLPGERLLEVIALVVRADLDGAAIWFLDLQAVEADRLLALAQ